METVNLPTAQGYGEAMRLAWRLLRQRFWSFVWLFVLAGLLALLPLVAVGLLQHFVARLALLWQLILLLVVNAFIVAIFRSVSLALAGSKADFAAFTGWLLRSDTWLIALLPALYGSVVQQIYPSPPPGAPAAAVIHFFLSPNYLLIVLLGVLVSPWYQYAFALYGTGGFAPVQAYRLALRIYGDRLRWLFFPLVLGLVVLLALVVSGIALALVAGLLGALLHLMGLVALSKALTATLIALFLALFLCAAMVFMTASLIVAATNLPRAPAAGEFRP